MFQDYVPLTRPRFARQLFKPLWRWLVTLPVAFLGAVALVRDEFLPTLAGTMNLINYLPSWERVVLILLILILLIAGESCFRMMKEKDRRLWELENAWDRTDKNLISIKDALSMIVESLDFEPTSTEGERLKKAASKIREIGIGGEIVIWGCEYSHENKTFTDHKVHTGSMFWNYNLLELGNVMTANPDLSHTVTDSNIDALAQPQLKYGRLMISGKTLAAMFPKRQV